MKKRLPHLNASQTKQLITFATAGGGMLTAISMLRKASHERLTHLRLLFRQWLGARTLREFYESWFEVNNFSCDEVRRTTGIVFGARVCLMAPTPFAIRNPFLFGIWQSKRENSRNPAFGIPPRAFMPSLAENRLFWLFHCF